MPFVIDASVVGAWLLLDEKNEASEWAPCVGPSIAPTTAPASGNSASPVAQPAAFLAAAVGRDRVSTIRQSRMVPPS